MLSKESHPAFRSLFWIVVGSSLVVGGWLVVTEHLLPAAAVLLSGAVLGVVLALLSRPRGSGIVDVSSSGLRRRGRAMVWTNAALLTAGVVGWFVADGVLWRVLILAGGGGLLGSVAVLWTARHADDQDSTARSSSAGP